MEFAAAGECLHRGGDWPVLLLLVQAHSDVEVS